MSLDAGEHTGALAPPLPLILDAGDVEGKERCAGLRDGLRDLSASFSCKASCSLR